MDPLKETPNTIVNKLKTTTNLAEFIAICHSLQNYTHNSFDMYIDCGVIPILVNSLIDNKLLERFDIKFHIPRFKCSVETKVIIVTTLAMIFTSEKGFHEFQKLNTDQVSKEVMTLYNSNNIDYKKSVVIFVSNLSIYDARLVDKMNLQHIVGDNKFSCLDEKNVEIMKRQLIAATVYYDVGLSVEKIELLLTEIEKRRNIFDADTLEYMYNMFITFIKALKIHNHGLKIRINKLLN